MQNLSVQSNLRCVEWRETMANIHKENPRYNVVSLRVTDEEKADLEEVTRRTRKSLSKVMREAILLYSRDVTLFSASTGC
jgi:arsenate reductase-like glutaredoxin family protein